LIVAGTLAFAGFGAAALNAAPDGRDLSPSAVIGTTGQSYPSNCHPDPDGDGNLVCQIAVSQVSAYPNADCDAIADGSGMVTCWIHPRD
jgi:hypothetical protein